MKSCDETQVKWVGIPAASTILIIFCEVKIKNAAPKRSAGALQ
jgi:hypothetical protein